MFQKKTQLECLYKV